MRPKISRPPALVPAFARAVVAAGLVGAFFVLGTPCLGAQPGFRYIDSIEVTVANADHVFVGRIISSAIRDTTGRVSVSVSIEQTIKGDHGESGRRLGLDLALGRSIVEQWQSRGSRLLVAAVIGAGDNTAIDLSSGAACVYTEAFTCLRTAAAVIQAATDVVERMPAGVKRVNMAAFRFPPGTLDGGSGYDYSTTYLRLPVNDRLERRARDILRGTSNFDRADAVRALGYFKSDENIRLIKSLLTDPAKGMNTSAEQNRGVQIEFYTIRERAYDVLSAWGIDVPEPIFREVTVHPDRVTSVPQSNWPVRLANLRGLVTDTTLRELTRAPNLTDLDLTNNRLSERAWDLIAGIKTLQRLDLVGTTLTDATLTKLGALPLLKELDLRRTSLTPAGLTTLGELSTLKRLRLSETPDNAAAVAALRGRRPDLVIETR